MLLLLLLLLCYSSSTLNIAIRAKIRAITIIRAPRGDVSSLDFCLIHTVLKCLHIAQFRKKRIFRRRTGCDWLPFRNWVWVLWYTWLFHFSVYYFPVLVLHLLFNFSCVCSRSVRVFCFQDFTFDGILAIPFIFSCCWTFFFEHTPFSVFSWFFMLKKETHKPEKKMNKKKERQSEFYYEQKYSYVYFVPCNFYVYCVQ